MPTDCLTLSEARRIALAAQDFDRPRPTRSPSIEAVRRVIHKLGLLQLDYVNVLCPAHYQVLFSRLGHYDRSKLNELVYRRREFTEQWAHEASIVPMDAWPLLQYRRNEHRVRPYGFEAYLEKHGAYVQHVLDDVAARGPLTPDNVVLPPCDSHRLSDVIPGAWVGTIQRAVLEAHFGRGHLAVADRRPNFGRSYDLAERVIPTEHHGRTMDRADAQRELLRRAARAHGIATAADLADYFRMPVPQARPRLAELTATGDLQEVRVEGWREPAYRHRDAACPQRIAAAALLSPFDPVVWHRPRAARLFDFDYRVEIFVPKEKRRWGYYVLPFLLDERLVARVDLKADRIGRRLLVLASYREAHAKPGRVAPTLAAELRTLATWLNLDSITVERRGDLSGKLAAVMRAAAPEA
jgi:uncharacterized protein YcaQ